MTHRTILVSITFLIIGLSSLSQVTGVYTDSRDGKKYKTVMIGTQTWMAQNLAYKTVSGCWAYDNKQINVATYGYLYNWQTAKEACPAGWHLPSEKDWNNLRKSLGPLIGKEMKSTSGWAKNGNGSNSSGFSALPGGCRYEDGIFGNIGEGGYWWCLSEEGNSIWVRNIIYNNPSLYEILQSKQMAYSVRCVKD